MPAVNASSPYSSCALRYSLFGQELALLERGQARLDDDVVLEIEDALEVLQRHVEQQADARRQRLQEPDVRDRARPARCGPCARAAPSASVTSTPHFSQMMPLYFMRLYLPHKHS